jgi:hypothetical protein
MTDFDFQFSIKVLEMTDEIRVWSFQKIGLLFGTGINQRQILRREISRVRGIIIFRIQCDRPARGNSV